MALSADWPESRAVPVTDRYPAWIWAPQSDRKPFVTFRNTTEGRISRSEMLLVAGTSRLVRKTKNLPRHALICLSSTFPAACAMGSVANHIPVISTSEIADAKGLIDGRYTNEALTDGVELVLGGPIIDLSDTALDAVFSGLGFISIIGLVKGIARGANIYRETGNAVEGLTSGVGVTFEESVWAIVNLFELVTRGAMAVSESKPARYLAVRFSSASRAATRSYTGKWE